MFRRRNPPTGPASSTAADPDTNPAATTQARPAEPASAPRPPNADKIPDPTARPSMNTTPTQPSNPMGNPLGGNPLSPSGSTIPRRVVDIPGQAPKRVAPTGTEGGSAAASTDMRKLIVGRDISLSGEIAACDVLVVEGTVEAKLREGKIIEIADTGLFKGSVEIDDADIGGRFEGDITVKGTLRVRSGGKIQGNIRYGTLEVEQGGQLSGTIEVLTGKDAKAPAPRTEAQQTEAAE